ncbi:MAG: hypothetical protein BGO31_12895 [Bacteroidetes bacterium 43-16]|nr:MAG: hypothetical protein BGO31_12895 [Bacteroidetes bacterium 43-16]
MEYNQEKNAIQVGELVAKEIQGLLSEEESAILNNWKNQSVENQEAYASLYTQKEKLLARLNRYDAPKALERVLARHRKNTGAKRIRTYWYAAASILVLFTTGLFYYLNTTKTIPTELVSAYGDDVQPGGNNAYITLSDGQRIELDSMQSGVITLDGKHTYADGTEIHSSSGSENATIHTPVGGEYQLQLPDGTKAWLNAASSLSYPVRFTGNERKIAITGEVYLEVSPNKAKPFIVESEGQQIEVLGTEFNVRHYGTQTITTLLQGKIALTNEKANKRSVLIPGQQAMVSVEATKIQTVDPHNYIAWKDGFILVQNANLDQVCEELERWYGVKFFQSDGFHNKERAFISFDRNVLLSTVLLSLEKTYGVQFSVKGKEVYVK